MNIDDIVHGYLFEQARYKKIFSENRTSFYNQKTSSSTMLLRLIITQCTLDEIVSKTDVDYATRLLLYCEVISRSPLPKLFGKVREIIPSLFFFFVVGIIG